MRLYYQSPNGRVRIYVGRAEDLPGVVDPRRVALAHMDPPYGQEERTRRRRAGRGLLAGSKTELRNINGRGRPQHHDWPEVLGDDRPYDPAPVLAAGYPRLLCWGATRYASRLPDSPSWITWDKRAGTPSDDNGDVELAWSNLGGPARRVTHLWRGTCRASETGVPHLSPTQKPEAVVRWVLSHRRLRDHVHPGAVLVAGYLGSGPELRPALESGLSVVGADASPFWCELACRARLGVTVQHYSDAEEAILARVCARRVAGRDVVLPEVLER